MDVKISPSWKAKLNDEFSKEYFVNLAEFVKQEYRKTRVYPPGSQIFKAFDECDFDNLRVVILGQDPYHGPGQANGLAFSVNPGIEMPPSLVNIFKEVKQETGKPMPPNGDLTRWAQQGVLLLNATLTVRAHKAGSHQKKGWEQFTDAVIQRVSEEKEDVVFLLWGSFAKKKRELINESKNLVLTSPHPSPLSANRGFFGNNHFIKTNEYLQGKGKDPVDW